ncbi:uncharacterized protein [Rutidosis leptorrhynchoides]|uniref:uncharacterized protein n=1 Tax=Rutidosis leptorrhynchoides TaxID=125765 RepID=UPI003A9A11B7
MIGKRFTRFSDDGAKLSKLDRFLVTNDFMHMWDDLSTLALDRKLSDHCPLILRDNNKDFGPKPFKLFDIWLESLEVEKIIVDAWNDDMVGSRMDCVFRNKLKKVKDALRKWSKTKYGSIDIDLISAKKEAMEWESKAESSILNSADRNKWVEARNKWLQKDREKAQMLKQKARLKWAIEGDDNTKFFHSSIKRRQNKSKIRGLHINGIWAENPTAIKKEVFNYFQK